MYTQKTTKYYTLGAQSYIITYEYPSVTLGSCKVTILCLLHIENIERRYTLFIITILAHLKCKGISSGF